MRLYSGSYTEDDPHITYFHNEEEFDDSRDEDFNDGDWDGPGYYTQYGYSKPCPRSCCTDYCSQSSRIGSNMGEALHTLIYSGEWNQDMGDFALRCLPLHLQHHANSALLDGEDLYTTFECGCGATLKYSLLDGGGEAQLALAGWIANNKGAICPDCN